jgi:hypothetical protein
MQDPTKSQIIPHMTCCPMILEVNNMVRNILWKIRSVYYVVPMLIIALIRLLISLIAKCHM